VRGWLRHVAARGRWGPSKGAVAHPGRTPGMAFPRLCVSVLYSVVSHDAGLKTPNACTSVAKRSRSVPSETSHVKYTFRPEI
jgi:hypothetical protein